MRKTLNVIIFGRVQGVFFRQTAKQNAERLGIFGFAENRPDGSVYIEAEGEEAKLMEFIAWCRKGPPLAKVERIKVEKMVDDTKRAKDFEIR